MREITCTRMADPASLLPARRVSVTISARLRRGLRRRGVRHPRSRPCAGDPVKCRGGRSGSSCGAPRRGSAPEPAREGRRRRLHRLVPRRHARRRVYHQRRDNPAGTAAGQEAPQEAAEPATARGLAGDRCGRRPSADRRDHGACCPGRNQPAARTEGGTDRDGQRAGAAADRDGHSAPARPDYHRHAAAAGPDRHHSVPAPWPALRRCIACPAPARSTRLNRDRRGNWRDSAGRGSRQPRPVRQPGRTPRASSVSAATAPARSVPVIGC